MRSTAYVITAIARRTSHCEKHGLIEAVKVGKAGITQRGAYFRAATYTATFADGVTKIFWMRASEPVEIK